MIPDAVSNNHTIAPMSQTFQNGPFKLEETRKYIYLHTAKCSSFINVLKMKLLNLMIQKI